MKTTPEKHFGNEVTTGILERRKIVAVNAAPWLPENEACLD
jgi:hypothetical protein